jgi:hypothetical protein
MMVLGKFLADSIYLNVLPSTWAFKCKQCLHLEISEN